MSFGGDEAEEEEPVTFKKKSIVRPDRESPLSSCRPRALIRRTVVESADVASAIPPAVSQAPKPKAPRPKETSEPRNDEAEKPKKSKKDEVDLVNIRAKHEQEKSAQRCVYLNAFFRR